jgi:hypothetical protein
MTKSKRNENQQDMTHKKRLIQLNKNPRIFHLYYMKEQKLKTYIHLKKCF